MPTLSCPRARGMSLRGWLRPVALTLEQASESPRRLAEGDSWSSFPESLMQQVWSGTYEFVFLTSSPVAAVGPHIETVV